MKESIRAKLETTRERFEEIAGLLAEPEVIAEQNQFRDLSREYSRLEPIVNLFAKYGNLQVLLARETSGGIRT